MHSRKPITDPHQQMNFPWPPLLYATAVAAALLLGNLFQLSLPARNLQMTVGVTLLFLPVPLNLWALKTLFSAAR
jgi:hypothetical protein